MPLPKPNKNEPKDDFMGRCMETPTMIEEYPDEKQRYAVCQSQWGDKDGKMGNKIERGCFEIKELRTDGDGDRKIIGHAALFNTISEAAGWYHEQIAPGAFAESLKTDDIRAVWNHNDQHVLGRNTNGTLNLSEDERGLYIEITPPDTQYARDLINLIDRGDISQMSFGFETKKDEWEKREGKPDLRTIKEVKLWEVSPVTFPFYDQTDVALRSHKEWKKTQKKHPRLRMQRKLKINRRSVNNE